MNIEKIATAAVTGYISKSNSLSPFISEGDKEPFWDGNIYIYNNETIDNNNYINRVPVQVKGKTTKKRIEKERYKYHIDIIDLKSYEARGVLYFVVYIDNDCKAHIYYSLLTPVTIRRILLRYGNQAGRNIEFIKLPDLVQFAEIILNFAEDCDKQTSFVKNPNFQPIDIDKVCQEQLPVQMTIKGIGKGTSSIYNYMLSNSVYLYKKASEEGYPDIPIDRVSLVALSRTANEGIFVNGIKFFDEFKISQIKDSFSIHIGHCIKIAIRDNNTCNFNISLNTSIESQIEAIKFLLAFSSKLAFSLGETELKVNLNEGFDTDEFVNRLKYLENIKIALDKLGVRENLVFDYENFKDEYRDALRVLIKVLVKEESYSNKGWKDIQRVNMQIFNIYLPLVFVKGKDGRKDTFYNELSKQSGFVVSLEKNGSFFAPQSILLDAADYESISELYYNDILSSLTGYGSAEPLAIRLNYSLLNMLLAYDKNRNEKLLDTAISFSQWVYDNCLTLDEDIRMINQLQAVKRKRSLESTEIEMLNKIIMGTTNPEISTAAYLLLEQINDAKQTYKQIKDKKAFKGFPIYRFMNLEKAK